MNNITAYPGKNKTRLSVFLLAVLSSFGTVCAQQNQHSILESMKINPTAVDLVFSNHSVMTVDFYSDNIFRIFQDNNGGFLRDPISTPPARILVAQPRVKVSGLEVNDNDVTIDITTPKVKISFDKKSTLFTVTDLQTQKVVIEEIAPVQFEDKRVTLRLKENPEEYFFGGGVQNGRFSHKGKVIAIENQNSWTDGGVSSPTPFYWSTRGYGIMWYTFEKGKYDFGAGETGVVKLYHETDCLDLFFMVNDGLSALLNDFYQLTGHPVLLPKFGFYQGHLNAYNRDYWKEDEKGILFEDGKRYKESQKDNGGFRESLNGEKGNYQFSARAVIDRYKHHDMPLGWILPNDGYGSGYGQAETLDSNIQNLKNLCDYARQQGVQTGLWTQSDLHPKLEVSALLQRDIIREVRDAGVRALKTDVAWVGAGYSFGLNGVADIAHVMSYYGNGSRPFIISIDGWAGTQRYAGIWSGDQTGGIWEYIRFHIPTYIGSGLSGQPNITSDVDGIFGGQNPVINTRDFQWKAFTPTQLNMDGWGSNEKYPHALGEPVASINRWYLKLKSEMMPYTYSIAREAVDGLPIIRAMFTETPNAYTLGKSTQYQFMYGPYFLIAPIYQSTSSDEKGNDIRNGIYLPEGNWIDYFTGDRYEGNRILNNFAAPLWKLPVFVKGGSIIPLTNPNNNVSEINGNLRIYELYPEGHSAFTEYDDDGITEAYKAGEGATTLIESEVDAENNVRIIVHPTRGNFDGFVTEKATEFRVNVTDKPKKITAKIGKDKIKLTEVYEKEDFLKQENVCFYDASPNLNRFATPGSDFEKEVITKNPQLLIKLASTNITAAPVILDIAGFAFTPTDKYRRSGGQLTAPTVQITDENREAYTLKPTWDRVENADFYEIEFNDMLYSTITDTGLLFENLNAESSYDFKIRAVNKDGHSEWATFSAVTKPNPLEFALRGITGETTAENQEGQNIDRLFDHDETNLWHTIYGANSVPFELTMDLNTISQLDKFHYLPRTDAGNGTILKGTVFYSMDKESWTEAGTFDWAKDNEVKIFSFKERPAARYIKISVTSALGGFGSGRELYVFKVPGTESYLPGDINNDRLIDMNDFTSYMNYTGLRRGDADFEGYIGNGDINRNGLIDAYDISTVATRLKGGIESKKETERVDGTLKISTAKQYYNKDEIIEMLVEGDGLKAVNAVSFAVPYNQQDYEFIGVELQDVNEMENLTVDRLHTNGEKAVYPTFVNLGDKRTIEGTANLFILKFKARRKLKFDLKAVDGLLVDKQLHTRKF